MIFENNNDILSGASPWYSDLYNSCPVYGCIDPNAINYDPNANTDDESCCFGAFYTIIMEDIYGDGWNGNILSIDNYEIEPINVFKFIKNHKNKFFDVIFVDAPFNTNELVKKLDMLDEYGFLIENHYIYIEQNKKDYNPEVISIINKTHNILKDLSIGDVSYTIAKKRDK